MKRRYRIHIQHNELDGTRTSTIYIPEFRSVWTLFMWTRLGAYDVYGSREEAETAIRIHRGDVKTVDDYEIFE